MNHAVVTGATSGIGESICKKFTENNWSLTMIGRRTEKLEALCAKWANAKGFSCDLSDPEDILSLGKKLQGESIQALVNNAGIFKPLSLDDDEDSVWQDQWNSNLMSAVRLTRVVWPQLKDSKGCVLNISSTLGIRPIANTAAYSASKAAMNNWTQALAIEGAPHGVRANAICPGIIDTPIHSYMDENQVKDPKTYKQVQKAQPLGRTGKPEDVAAMAYHFCQPEAQWVTGTLFNIDGGILLNS